MLSNIFRSMLPILGVLALTASASGEWHDTQARNNLPDAPSASTSMTSDAGQALLAEAQDSQPASQSTPATQPQAQPSSPPAATPSAATPPAATKRATATDQVKQEEKQRALGIVPIFNVTYLGEDTVPLSSGQKFDLAFHSMVDPFVFFAAGLDAAYSQATDAFKGYGQGWGGYGKRFGAAYADSADGTLLGNAVLPSLLHQDPRYYRMGKGKFSHRFLYSISTTVRCKNDNGKWAPNYSNVLGNLAAGGISNIYYPSTDRGAALTVERGLTVTAEGTLGGIFDEFWPDVAAHFAKKHKADSVPVSQPASAPAHP